MKKIKNVNSISNSTVTTIVFSLVAMALLSIMLMTSVSFASELGDEFGGPGIGMKDTSWDGSRINKIYSYGDLNGIVGNEIVEHKASSTNGPTNYIEYTDDNPINHYLIDMGPKTASNANYSLHFKNDGGPGMNVESNALGKTAVYSMGGPGELVYGFAGTDSKYVDNGPTAVDSMINPSDFIKLLTMKPGDFTFLGGSKDDKLVK